MNEKVNLIFFTGPFSRGVPEIGSTIVEIFKRQYKKIRKYEAVVHVFLISGKVKYSWQQY